MLIEQFVYLDSDTVNVLSPTQVEGYLTKTGWIKAELEGKHGQIWERTAGEELPPHFALLSLHTRPHRIWPGHVKALTSSHYRDYVGRTTDLLLTVAAFENRHVAHVLADVAAMPAGPVAPVA
ncbi:hypothetical protein SMD44_p10205 (plasmid) [Streptomyces alboflavus]|uniref:Uncharacterized protein n=1 Tax=Streptomyces alboflavus TaxID=67267 RepID=A0A291W3Y1_9ACTN|nr:hypothetical protein [Streptomyces alboflavus]ATM24704.1 hypothetical protein SMD44_p10205 [Streptomyces alboflavus]